MGQSELFQNFIRALNHRVRTPLTVISNDLTYLSSTTKDQSCERSLQKTRIIADLLKTVTLLSDKAAPASLVNSNLLAQKLGCLPITPAADIKCNLSALLDIRSILSEEIEEISGNPTQLLLERGASRVTIKIRVEMKEKMKHPANNKSLSGFLWQELGRDNPLIPLCEMLLMEMGAETEIVADGAIEIGIKFVGT